jgi:hypothetical protein
MIKIPIQLQDLRRKIYIKAKAKKSEGFGAICPCMQNRDTPGSL